MIIGIAGKAGCGKDTFADELVRNYSFARDALAAPIKRFVADTFCVSEEIVSGITKMGRIEREKELKDWNGWTTRRLLQFIGTELMRNQIDKDIWVKSLALKIKQQPDVNWVITDVRFENERRFFKEMFKNNFVLVKIIRGEKYMINGIENHESESYDLKADFIIHNNGTLQEFKAKIKETTSQILGGKYEHKNK